MSVGTNGQVGEDAEGALQEGDQVDQVVAGAQAPASGGRCHPVVVGQLQELVDLGVEVGVDLRLRRMTSVLQKVEDLFKVCLKTHKNKVFVLKTKTNKMV